MANDTCGAIAQLVMVHDPERVGRVVLTPSDCFERFFPPPFAFLPTASRLPGALWLLVLIMRVRALSANHLQLFTKRPVPLDIVNSYLEPSLRDA